MTAKIPGDLITSREAVDQLGIGYWRLHDWFQRGVIRSWKMGRLRLVSRAEVRRELRKRESVKPVARTSFMGEIARPERPERAAASAPRHRNPTASPTGPLPDSAPAGPGWTPAGPWGYTVD